MIFPECRFIIRIFKNLPKKVFLLWICFVALHTDTVAQEHYIRFSEKDKTIVNELVTRIVSIHRIDDGAVFAFANHEELAKLRSLGYFPEILAHPSTTTRDLDMAETVDEMANWDKYPTYEVYRAMMKRFEMQFPDLCKLDSIGTTVNGRKLYVMKISNEVHLSQPKPELFYTSTMHGNETTGYILMLRLIDYLLNNFGSDERITRMLNETVICINPNANPDGTYRSGNHTVAGATRANANGRDLNRNFPDPRVGENPGGPYQPETIAMMEYAQSRFFVLSANFHDGAELVNYPWDAWKSSVKKHADHNWFEVISVKWAELVHENSPAGYFQPGYIHGGDWYVVAGGRQDYMNYRHHCREVTLEIHDQFLTGTEMLPLFWDYQKESLLGYIEWLYTGIQGTVKNAFGIPLNARITVLNHDKDESYVMTNPYHGNFVRLIEPGTWQIRVSAPGYTPQVHSVEVSDIYTATTLHVVLENALKFSISGRVVDAESQEPVVQARLELKGSQTAVVYSDTLGYFILDSIPEGVYDLFISAEGYITGIQSVDLNSDLTLMITGLYKSQPERFDHGLPSGFLTDTLPWTIDPDVSFDGEFSLRSYPVGDNSRSEVEIQLNLAHKAELSFAVRISSEESYDFLKFYINDQEKASWSGLLDWQVVSFGVDTGFHVFKWSYVKDQTESVGEDCAWIDFIVFPQSFQTCSFHVLNEGNGQSVEQAEVSLGNDIIKTSQDGLAVFNQVLRDQSKAFSAHKEGFFYWSDSIQVQYMDIFDTIYLRELDPKHTVRFFVMGAGQGIYEARVILGIDTLFSDPEGSVHFEGIDPGHYSYSVNATGFVPVDDSVLVQNDTVLYLLLTPVSIDESIQKGIQLHIWPNPFRDQVHFLVEADKTLPVLLEVFDISGSKIAELTGRHEHGSLISFTWEPHSSVFSQAGVYYVRVVAGAGAVLGKAVMLR